MTYEERHAKLTEYLQMKVEEKDWHGVSDAANDLRVLEASWGPTVLTHVVSELPKIGSIRVVDGIRYEWKQTGKMAY